jgi:hypothetical protein
MAASRSMSARPGAGPSGACPGPGPGSARRSPVIIRLDGGQGVARLGGTGVEDPAARAGLDRDDADAVRHDVVQFASDPQPLRQLGLGGGLGPPQLGLGLRLPDRMSDKPGNDRDNGHAAPERRQIYAYVIRNQQAGADHGQASGRDSEWACRG